MEHYIHPLQVMREAGARQQKAEDEGLLDYRLQELLLQGVIPHLSLVMLARLRATCSNLQSLLDSDLDGRSGYLQLVNR